MATPGSFKPGQSGNLKGRPKGIPNKMTKSAKEAFEFAFQGIGGKRRLKQWAKENETEFFKLYANKMIPNRQELTGKDGENLFKNLPDEELNALIKDRLTALPDLKELLPDGI